MATVPIARTEHRVPNSGAPRTTDVTHAELAVDHEKYARAVERIHNSAHGTGVVEGLTVAGIAGTANVRIGPGTAIDPLGRHVVLAVGEHAEIGPDPDAESQLAEIQAIGVDLSTAGVSGTRQVRLHWRETFDQDLYNSSGKKVFETRQTPWLRLHPSANIPPDPGVILATVSLDTDGAVVAIDRTDRSGPVPSVQAVDFRVASAAGLSITDLPAGRVGARPGGGLEVRVAELDDHLEVTAEHGTYAQTTLGTDRMVLRRADGTEPISLDARTARLGVGTNDPSHALHVTSHTGIRQNALYLSGGLGWSSLGYNAHHDARNAAWVFPNPSRPAVTVELDDYGEVPRLQVYTTTTDQPTEWQMRLGINGNTGTVSVPAGGLLHGVSVGVDPHPETSYDWSYETVGVTDARYNLRLRSPNQVVVHTYDAGEKRYPERLAVGGSGRNTTAVLGREGSGTLLTRHVDGKQDGSSTPGDLHLNWSTGHPVHVGGDAPADLHVHGQVHAGDLTLSTGTLRCSGRLHIDGEERLYVLNRQGVRISHAWGGNGCLVVEGKPGNTVGTIPDWSGGGVLSHDVFATGAVYVGNPGNPKCQFYGDGRKQFAIDHPLDPEHRTLNHACIEGPEVGVYYRGEGQLIGGIAYVDLPTYFEELTRCDGRTTMLTPICDADEPVTPLAATPVVDGCFTVRAADDRNPRQRFCWEVKAVRADVDRLTVETDKAHTSSILER
jgi:hypothetical protein